MKYFVLFVSIFVSFSAFAAWIPKGVGGFSIGMRKAEYQSAIGFDPTDCNTCSDWDGKVMRSELKYITLDQETLCWNYNLSKTGSTENFEVCGISYDVVEANYESSKVVGSIGHSSKAIFLKDRLISIEIYSLRWMLKHWQANMGCRNLTTSQKLRSARTEWEMNLRTEWEKLMPFGLMATEVQYFAKN